MDEADSETVSIRIADEVWLAVALLHREHPARRDFSIKEILGRVRAEHIHPELRAGVHVHVVQHCVANRPPNPGRSRMLVETARGRRRLYRPGDPYDGGREGARSVPDPGDVPERYRPLLRWYLTQYAAPDQEAPAADPLLALKGSGRTLWADEPADQYVTRLREGWS